MKFLLDENTSKLTAKFLTQLGHTVLRVKEIDPGMEDYQVLELAVNEQAIIITLDKDYGELIFKEGKLHSGVLFLRLENQTQDNTINTLRWFLSFYSDKRLINKFVTVTEKQGKLTVRFNKNKLQN
jgi:predicted nuclease of predicted toxin-antitoxin system